MEEDQIKNYTSQIFCAPNLTSYQPIVEKKKGEPAPKKTPQVQIPLFFTDLTGSIRVINPLVQKIFQDKPDYLEYLLLVTNEKTRSSFNGGIVIPHARTEVHIGEGAIAQKKEVPGWAYYASQEDLNIFISKPVPTPL